jgi:hypothetical protein
MNTQVLFVTVVKETCVSCGVIFALDESHRTELQKSHKSFYCPNGHSQYFPAQSVEEILRQDLARERQRSDQIKAELHDEKKSKYAIKGQLTKIKNRVSSGVCPCCKRYFSNLHRHMKTKHKEPK